MTIHTSHPFADPDPDPARRLRGRIGAGVTLWTAGEGADRVGLTVTSLMVALGPSPRLLALLDPDSDLLDVLRDTERAVREAADMASTNPLKRFSLRATPPA